MPSRTAVALLIDESHLVDFFDGGHSGLYLGQSAFAQRSHSFFARSSLNFRSRTAVHNHFADAVGEVHQFADSRPPVVASTGALQTSDAFEQSRVRPYFRIQSQFL